MSSWAVNLVSAFGRGESLALALQENGFNVRVLDFTEAFPLEHARGSGPFPITTQSFLPAQKVFLEEVRPLSRGLVFWLREGPLELSGPMAPGFLEDRRDVQNLRNGTVSGEFEQDWLRRFLLQWASPYQAEPWAAQSRSLFPFDSTMGLVSAVKEERVLSFERFQALDYDHLACRGMHDLQTEGSRLLEIELEAGQATAVGADQWIWCLSSEETEMISPPVAQAVFHRGIRTPQWRWLKMQGQCQRGPWSYGFPEYFVALEDIHLPWVYSNMAVIRWVDSDLYQVWLKVPAGSVNLEDKRQGWAGEVEQMLRSRLPQAKWTVDPSQWAVCPHSPVYDSRARGEGIPSWKNWDWIAPETLERLDLSARLERESGAYHRLIDWRNDQMKKQGARRDSALHTP